MRKPHYLAPEKISPLWEGHPGPYWIGYDELEKIMPGISAQEVTLKVPTRMLDGHVNRDELTLINSITRYLQPRRVFEFGTFDGLTTLNFALNTPADAEIYTLDLPEGHAQPRYKLDGFNKKFLPKGRKLRFKGAPSASKIKQLMMDSAGLDTFGYGGKFDAVFVDGAHSYEYCKSDSQKAFEMVSRNGVVLWHDYGDNRQWPGVAEYLNYIAREKGYILYWLLKKNTDLMTSLVMHCNGFRR